MPRPTRRTLKFDEDSVNKLLQEIYDESHNIKANIVIICYQQPPAYKNISLSVGHGNYTPVQVFHLPLRNSI